MIRRFISKFQRKEFDTEQENITIHDYYTTLRLMFKLFGVVDGQRERPWYWSLYMVYVSACGALSVFLLWCDVQHAIEHDDISEATEASIYIIMFTYQTFILVGAQLDIEFYRNLRDGLEEAFEFISSPGGKRYRQTFYETQLLTWQLCMVWTASIVGICGSYFIKCSWDIFTLVGEDRLTKRFLVPLRTPKGLAPYESPYYELLTFHQYQMMLTFTPVFLAYHFVTLISIGHLVSQLGMVIGDIDSLFVDLPDTSDQRAVHRMLSSRMKSLVDRHDAAYSYFANLAAIYRKWNAYCQLISTPVVCLTAYTVSVDLDHRKFNYIMFMLLGGAAAQYLVPCWGITIIATKFSEVGAVCARAEWWGRGGASCAAARDLRLVVARAQRPLPDRQPGFRNLNLEEFLRAMTAAYSYFNMLRKINS